jgi:hypothetical protein
MRIALVTLLCTLVLTPSVGTNACADDESDAEKELKKFQDTCRFDFVESTGRAGKPARWSTFCQFLPEIKCDCPGVAFNSG